MVEHGGGVSYGVKPELFTNLFFSYIGMGFLDEVAPSALYKAVGGLATGIGSNNLAFFS